MDYQPVFKPTLRARAWARVLEANEWSTESPKSPSQRSSASPASGVRMVRPS